MATNEENSSQGGPPRKRKLSRRDFFKMGGAAGAGAAIGYLAAPIVKAGPPASDLELHDDYIQWKALSYDPSPIPMGGVWYRSDQAAFFASPDGSGIVPLIFYAGVSTGGNSLGNTVVQPGQLVFEGGTNITLSQITAAQSKATVRIIGAVAAAAALSAGTQSAGTGTILLADSNGLSFGMSASSRITGSYSVPVASSAIQPVGSATGSGTDTSRFAPDDHVHEGVFSVGVSTGGNTAGNTTVQAGQVVLQGGNSITLSQITAAGKNATVVISGPSAVGETPFGVSAGTQSVSTGTVVFSNSNNVSFGMSNSSIVTATASFPPETLFGISAGTQSVSTGTLVFSNSNNVSFGMSGSSRVTASFAETQTFLGGLGAGTQTATSGTVVFANSNNITFGMSASTQVTASFVETQTFLGAVAAGTQTATSGTVNFANSNGISFGMSNSTQITASYTVPTETPFGISAGTQSVSTGTVVFSNSNNVTFGMSGSSQVTASASFPSQTPFGISAGTQSVSTGTLVFSNSNGISFGMSGSSQVTASYTVPVVSNALQDVGTATGSGTNTSRLAADDHVHRGIRGLNVSGTTTVFFGDFTFNSGNMMSFATAGASTAGSLSVINLWSSATAASDVTTATAVGANNSRVALEAHQHRGIRGLNVSGTTTVFFGDFTFNSGNMMSFATQGASTAGSLSIDNLWSSATTASRVDSANAVGAMASRAALEGHQHAGLWQLSVGGNTTGGNTSAGAGSFMLAGGPGVTLSGATAAGGETVSISAVPNMLVWENIGLGASNTLTHQDASLLVFPLAGDNANLFPGNMTASTVMLDVSGTVSTGAAFTVSLSLGFFTLANSTQLSRVASASTSWGSSAANAGFTSLFQGLRYITIHSSQFDVQPTFSRTNYWAALWVRSTSGSQTWTIQGQQFLNTNQRSGTIGAGNAGGTSLAWFPLMGVRSASFSTAMPGAIAQSDLNKAVAGAGFVPRIHMEASVSSF